MLIQKYLDLGKDVDFAEGEVDAYLSDVERSGVYCLNLANSKSPLMEDPGGGLSSLPQYLGVFVGGFFISALLRSFGLFGGAEAGGFTLW